MSELYHDFQRIRFTSQEKMELTARLERAAEQEGTMTDTTKKKVRRLSRGMIIGIAAAFLLTTGALAAVLSPGLRSYFDAEAPGARERLERSIYSLDRSETYNGWTVTLGECVGDDHHVYIWVDVAAPEGTVLKEPENGAIGTWYSLRQRGEAEVPWGASAIYALPDEDPGDNKISFCIEQNLLWSELRGERVEITVGPILDAWWTSPGTAQAQYHEGGALTQAVRDHIWTFEDVTLDYPDQTVRLSLNQEVPYLDGSAVLTQVEISPLSAAVRIEGGACVDHNRRKAQSEHTAGDTEIISSSGAASAATGDGQGADSMFACWNALGFQLHMKDGRVLTPPTGAGSSCQDGNNPYYDGIPYVEGRFQYADEHSNLIPARIIDPAQVDFVTVCGVEIPLE